MKKLLDSGLEQQIYFFAINVVSFSKTLQKKDKNLNPEVVKIAAELNSTFMDILDFEDEAQIGEGLKKCKQLAEKTHKIFIDFDCDEKNLMNEKANLQIENSLILKKLAFFTGVNFKAFL